MTRSSAVAEVPPTSASRFWNRLLGAVAVGKAALGGAGAALAIAGAFHVAAAVTAQNWLHDVQKNYLDYVAIGGGVVGGTFSILSRMIWWSR
jgi:hypothetical protein